MTKKVATYWKSNSAKNVGVPYSSASVTYSSSTVAYSSATTGLDDFNKLASSWNKVNRTATQFNANPLANANLYPFDSATKVYDSGVDTYDGIVTGQDFGDIQAPTVWKEG